MSTLFTKLSMSTYENEQKKFARNSLPCFHEDIGDKTQEIYKKIVKKYLSRVGSQEDQNSLRAK